MGLSLACSSKEKISIVQCECKDPKVRGEREREIEREITKRIFFPIIPLVNNVSKDEKRKRPITLEHT